MQSRATQSGAPQPLPAGIPIPGARVPRPPSPTRNALFGRAVVLDTETTGLSPKSGDRMLELGAVELIDGTQTGRVLQCYFKPDQPASWPAAQRVHGISPSFLADKRDFAFHADEVLAFLGDSPIIGHNVQFDLRFLNSELQRSGRTPIVQPPIDTLALARRLFPGESNKLDALCARFDVPGWQDMRHTHSALVDARLTAQIYRHLTGLHQDLQNGFGPHSAPAVLTREPAMTLRQSARLQTLASAAHEIFDPTITQRQASAEIDRLSYRLNRPASPPEPMTQRQAGFLRRLCTANGQVFNPALSKQDASALIDSLLAQQRNAQPG